MTILASALLWGWGGGEACFHASVTCSLFQLHELLPVHLPLYLEAECVIPDAITALMNSYVI